MRQKYLHEGRFSKFHFVFNHLNTWTLIPYMPGRNHTFLSFILLCILWMLFAYSDMVFLYLNFVFVTCCCCCCFLFNLIKKTIWMCFCCQWTCGWIKIWFWLFSYLIFYGILSSTLMTNCSVTTMAQPLSARHSRDSLLESRQRNNQCFFLVFFSFLSPSIK